MAAKKPNRVRDKKVAIVFDEDARREYLLGFRKRKNERRKKAHEQLQKLEREKKKQTKEERKKILIEQVEKQRMELEALESDDSSEDVVVTPSVNATFEHPEHIVTVTTINDIDLTTNRLSCISPNTCVLDNSKKSLSAPERPTGKLKMHQNAPFKKRKGFNKAKTKKSHGQKSSFVKGRKGKASNKKRKGSHQAGSSENSKRTKRS